MTWPWNHTRNQQGSVAANADYYSSSELLLLEFQAQSQQTLTLSPVLQKSSTVQVQKSTIFQPSIWSNLQLRHAYGGMVAGWSTFWDTRHPLMDEAWTVGGGHLGGVAFRLRRPEAGNIKGHAPMKNAWGEEATNRGELGDM